MARYVEHRPNGDNEDATRREALEIQLRILDNFLLDGGRGGDDDEEEDKCTKTGPFLVGNGTTFTLLDCSMAPKLYAMDVCLNELKGGGINLANDFPRLRQYMDVVFDRPSFKSTVKYGPHTVKWGWTSHLN
jgi:glutathione S-transferase